MNSIGISFIRYKMIRDSLCVFINRFTTPNNVISYKTNKYGINSLKKGIFNVAYFV